MSVVLSVIDPTANRWRAEFVNAVADAPHNSRCSACHAELAATAQFCSRCGARANEAAGQATDTFQPATPRSPSRSGLQGERFAPGQVFVERFRIVTVLGKGGMGEVFRADDLSLGQSVALKFLPQRLANDPERLARLRGEVKAARQVAHPNVCRVYDLGQADGQLFLSMEYVDGQNLAALLAQIRRLPEERGVEIARQLCLGLGAIHDRGLLHRDLKPANVMLDGRGQVRITDFGLAAPADGVKPEDITDGTPAYQSPEQLAGREVTARSDLYALGLILYELFTGKLPFAATDRVELARSHAEDPPSKPSSHVSGLNPAIEKIILQCLEKDPRDRPRTAYEVLAGLPGGDPLAAALAAGQTPSPAVVADAKVEGSLHPLVSLGLLLGMVLGLALILLMPPQRKLWELAPHQLSPRDLAGRAQELIKQFGYDQLPRDTAYGLNDSGALLMVLGRRDSTPARWQILSTGQPPAMYFWYRQSSRWIVPQAVYSDQIHGLASADNPPLATPGSARVCLDLTGRLIEFQVVPAQSSPQPPAREPAPALDWPRILAQAGLVQIQETKDRLAGWSPPLFVDERLAWRAAYADCPDIPVRVEAGLREGRLVFFQAAPEPQPGEHMSLLAESPSVFKAQVSQTDSPFNLLLAIFQLLMLSVGGALAWHNIRLGRANLRGTAFFGGAIFAGYMVGWAFSAHHVPDYFVESGMLVAQIGSALFLVVAVSAAYLALEPYVRRRWPWRVVAWNRALAGRWRDPLVGRDVLVGLTASVALLAMVKILSLTRAWLEYTPGLPATTFNPLFTAGPAAGLPLIIAHSAGPALAGFFMLFLLYLLTRREWLAILVYAGIYVIPAVLTEGNRPVDVFVHTLMVAGFLTVTLRYGLLAYGVMGIADTIIGFAPLTADWNAWYAGDSLVYLAALVALAVYGFVVSSGGQWLAWVGHLTGEAREPVESQPA